jgi:hypothetical protein
MRGLFVLMALFLPLSEARRAGGGSCVDALADRNGAFPVPLVAQVGKCLVTSLALN